VAWFPNARNRERCGEGPGAVLLSSSYEVPKEARRRVRGILFKTEPIEFENRPERLTHAYDRDSRVKRWSKFD